VTTWINLLPPEIQQRRRAKRITAFFLLGFAILIIFMLFTYGALTYRVYQQEKVLSQQKQQGVELTSEISELKAYEAKQTELQGMDNAISRALAGRKLWSRIMNELSMVIPSDVWLIDFTGDAAAGVSLRGYTFDHPAVAKWMVRQKEIKELGAIGLQYSKKEEVEKQNVIEFNTTAQFAGVQAPPAKASIPARSAKR
jgi:Tfp pilus assembly protein PilN